MLRALFMSWSNRWILSHLPPYAASCCAACQKLPHSCLVGGSPAIARLQPRPKLATVTNTATAYAGSVQDSANDGKEPAAPYFEARSLKSAAESCGAAAEGASSSEISSGDSGSEVESRPHKSKKKPKKKIPQRRGQIAKTVVDGTTKVREIYSR